MDSFDILVIILSTMLGIFLLSGIIVLILIIKLVKKIHAVTDKAVHAVESVEDMAETLRAATTGSVLGGIGMKLWKQFYKNAKKK